MYDVRCCIVTHNRRLERLVRISTNMRRRGIAVRLAVVFILSVLGWQPHADAVQRQNITVELTSTDTLQLSDYTIGRFRSEKDELVVGYTLAFPPGTDATGATAEPGDTVSIVGTTVTVMFAPTNRIQPKTNGFSIAIGNIRNPPTAGQYEITGVTFHTELEGVPTDSSVPLYGKGAYTITPAPYLSLTITTPNEGQSVDFGAIDPGISTGSKDITLEVQSSAQYTITRTVSGDAGPLGLVVTGVPVGVLQAAAPTPKVHTDSFTLAPPWSTDPEVPLSAAVTYTVVQGP